MSEESTNVADVRVGEPVVRIEGLRKAFGDNELNEAIKRGAIRILDEATIEAMKEKRARDKAKDEKEKQQQAIEAGEQTDWQQAMKEWAEWKKGKDGEK